MPDLTIDLDRYPIVPLGDARAQALAGDCRAQLAATGSDTSQAELARKYLRTPYVGK